MVLIEIANKTYQFFNDWKDIIIQKAIDWVEHDVPECLDNAIKQIEKDGIKGYLEATKEYTPEEKNKIVPEYIGLMIKTFTNIPDDVLTKIGGLERTKFFHEYLFNKLLDVYLMSKMQLQDIRNFKFKGKTYHLPKIGKMVNGDSLGVDLMAIEFAESSDLMTNADKLKAGNISALPYLLAILCKEDGETYNEEKINEKAKAFLKLDMQTAWEVFFFIFRCLRTLQENTVQSLVEMQATYQRKLQQINQASIKRAGSVN